MTRFEATVLRAAADGISRADLYRRVKDRVTADCLSAVVRGLMMRNLLRAEMGARPAHGLAALRYHPTGVAFEVDGTKTVRPGTLSAPRPDCGFGSIHLQAAWARLASNAHRYRVTQPGRVDAETLKVAATLKNCWEVHPGEPVVLAELERRVNAEHGAEVPAPDSEEQAEVAPMPVDAPRRTRFPLAVTFLAKHKLVKLTSKGRVIEPGAEWCENDAA